MRRVRRSTLPIVGALLMALTAACGCGSAAAPSKPAPQASSPPVASRAPQATRGLPKVTLLLDIPANGSMAPYFVALDKGYYRRNGLDMTRIIDGHGSVLTAEDVAGGHNTFGYAAADSAAGVISKGGPAKMVSVWIQQNPAVILFKSNAPIHRPTDLYGKKVGVRPGTAIAQQWTAFEKAAHLDPQRIQTVTVSTPAQPAALASGRIAALPTFGYSFIPQVERLGVKLREFKLSNYGIDDLAGGIIVSDATLQAHPAWVRGFLAAVVKAYAFCQQHPDQAIAIERVYRPTIPVKAGVEELKLSFQLLHTKASAHAPLGYMERADWVGTLATAHDYEGMTKVLPVADYYTNAYLPGAQ